MTSTALTSRPVRTADGVSLATRWWRTPTARATVVVVHGFAASSSNQAVVRQAEALHAAGFDVFAYDSRGHGSSDGLCTLGELEAQDVAAAVRTAVAETGRERAILVGASMGAIAVLRHAAASDAEGASAVQGVVAISCPSRWEIPRSPQAVLAAALTQTRLGRRLVRHHLRVRMSKGWRDPEPPGELVQRLEVPVAFVHGERDRFIPAAHSVRLFRASNRPHRFDLVPGMGHSYDALGVSPVVSAVEWVLAVGG